MLHSQITVTVVNELSKTLRLPESQVHLTNFQQRFATRLKKRNGQPLLRFMCSV
ncbi:unnamed protein product [Brugia timori]|uniref:Uncharacterized protein n=1 Tax=Brugia timori TaxID=42155 RepID=A0A3P7TNS5_9BILA|nr:unnamed protein product [Brugia timori]